VVVIDTASSSSSRAAAASVPAERPVYEAAKKKGYLQVMLLFSC
jgi:hypothetical protein